MTSNKKQIPALRFLIEASVLLSAEKKQELLSIVDKLDAADEAELRETLLAEDRIINEYIGDALKKVAARGEAGFFSKFMDLVRVWHRKFLKSEEEESRKAEATQSERLFNF